MSRRAAIISQADIARVIRAYRSAGVEVRTRILTDGSTSFEPIEKEQAETADVSCNEKEIVL